LKRDGNYRSANGQFNAVFGVYAMFYLDLCRAALQHPALSEPVYEAVWPLGESWPTIRARSAI